MIKTKVLNLFRTPFKTSFLEQELRATILKNPDNVIWSKLVPNNYQYKKNSMRTFTYKDAVNLKVDISDYVGHYLYFGFKDEGQDKLFNLVRKGNVVLDIGTNIGSTLLRMASIVEETGFIYGFEPDPINYENCMQNIALNSFKNVRVSQIGLGSSVGSFDLVVDTESNRGGNRISFQETLKNITTISVNTLDKWMQENKVLKIDVIKIDVEGFELKVLKGGEEAINTHKPQLFIELDDDNLRAVDDSASSLIKLLEDWGYDIVHAESNEKIHSNDDFSNCHYDVVAKKKNA